MSEKVKDILAMNLQVNLVQLEEAKAKVKLVLFPSREDSMNSLGNRIMFQKIR